MIFSCTGGPDQLYTVPGAVAVSAPLPSPNGEEVQVLSSRFVFKIVCGVVLASAIVTVIPVCKAADFSWSVALDAPTQETAQDSLIVVIVTNDVPAEQIRPSKKRTVTREMCWCERSLRRSAAKIPAGFTAPSAPIQFQHWAIGLPPILTGGMASGDVGRAMVFITDGQYRILAMSVGVPEGDDLTRLIEDAEDTRLLLRRHGTDPNELIKELADRTRGRLNRIWHIELDRQLAALGDGDSESITNVFDEMERHTDSTRLQIGAIVGKLQGVYLKDVQMRYGLTDATDLDRLVILEQHAATRAPWVTILVPFLVGADLRVLYTDLAEIVWDRWVMPVETPSEHKKEAAALADWISQRGDRGSFAFRISPPLMIERAQNQQLDVARGRSSGWKDLEDAINAGPIRQVTLSELAGWLTQTNSQPVELQRPSRVRVLFFRSAKDSPYPIREGSPPGRAVTMIRQVQK